MLHNFSCGGTTLGFMHADAIHLSEGLTVLALALKVVSSFGAGTSHYSKLRITYRIPNSTLALLLVPAKYCPGTAASSGYIIRGVVDS